MGFTQLDAAFKGYIITIFPHCYSFVYWIRDSFFDPQSLSPFVHVLFWERRERPVPIDQRPHSLLYIPDLVGLICLHRADSILCVIIVTSYAASALSATTTSSQHKSSWLCSAKYPTWNGWRDSRHEPLSRCYECQTAKRQLLRGNLKKKKKCRMCKTFGTSSKKIYSTELQFRHCS